MHSQACCAKILLSTLGRNILTLCRATMHIFRACMISREFSHGRFLRSFKVNWNVSQFCLNWERLELTILWREAKTNLHRKQNYTTQDENYRTTSLDLPEDCNWSSTGYFQNELKSNLSGIRTQQKWQIFSIFSNHPSHNPNKNSRGCLQLALTARIRVTFNCLTFSKITTCLTKSWKNYFTESLFKTFHSVNI